MDFIILEMFFYLAKWFIALGGNRKLKPLELWEVESPRGDILFGLFTLVYGKGAKQGVSYSGFINGVFLFHLFHLFQFNLICCYEATKTALAEDGK